MIVRELITLLGFQGDPAGAVQYERRTEQTQRKVEQSTSAISRAWEKASRAADAGLARMDRGLEKVQSGAQLAADGLGGIGSMLMGGLGFAGFANTTSQFTDLHSRLKVATEGTVESTDKLLNGLNDVALRTYQDTQQVVDGFLQMKPGLDQLGLSMEDQVNVLQSMNDAMTVGGIKNDKAALAMMWLSRSFSAGKMSLEAFNGVFGAGDDLVVQWSKNTGKSVEELREMASAGKLTSKWLADHYLSTMERMRALSEEMPVTINDSMKRVTQTLGFWIYRMDKAYGASKKLADMFLWLADRPYLSGSIFFGGMALAAAAMLAQLVALGASGFRAIIRVTTALRSLTRAQLAAAATNPFAWVAAAIVGIQDLLVWVRGGDSVIGRLVGTLSDLEAIPATDRKWWQNWALGVAGYTKNVDAAGAATQKLFSEASNPPPDQSWSAWFEQLRANADKALFGAGGWAEWSPLTIDEGGKTAKAIDWLKSKFDQLAVEAGVAWETISAKLASELTGAVENVKASWDGMVSGVRSAFSSAVDFMLEKWAEFKAALTDNALARGVKGLLDGAAGLLGFGAPEVGPEVGPEAGSRSPEAGSQSTEQGGDGAGSARPKVLSFGGGKLSSRIGGAVDKVADYGPRIAAGLAAGVAPFATGQMAEFAYAGQMSPPALSRPGAAGGTNIGTINAPSTVNIERGAIPEGLSEERVASLVVDKMSNVARQVFVSELASAQSHFADPEA